MKRRPVLLSESELARVETTFGVELPRGYRMLRTRCAHLPRGVEWLETVEDLIDANTFLLGNPDWDAAYFAIAESGSGDYYCVELGSPDVVIYSHEEDEFHELGRFSEWIATLDAANESRTSPLGLLACFGLLLVLALIFLIPIWLALRANLP
jgi:hypothetical protein